MAKKKTLEDIKKCPIDFLYIWAGDEFISQLGSKSSIIAEKKYNQYQTLWRTMIDNEDAGSSEANQKVFDRWTKEIAQAIYNVYEQTPAEILVALANGKTVAGKNFKEGIFGVGETTSGSFSQNSNYTVDPTTGKIVGSDGSTPAQTPIYGTNGQIIGYSCVVGGNQYQSAYSGGQYVAFSYSNADGVQRANGSAFSASQGTFWQNAENYMPMVNNILNWLMSLVNTLLPGDRTVLTPDNTVPKQGEWVYEEESSTGWLGALLAGGAALALFAGKKGKKKKK